MMSVKMGTSAGAMRLPAFLTLPRGSAKFIFLLLAVFHFAASFVGSSPCPSGTFPLPYDKPDSSKGFTCSGHTWIAQQHVVGNTDCRLVLRHNTQFWGHDIGEFPKDVMDYKNAMAQCPVFGCIGMICRGSSDPQSVPNRCWMKDQTHLTVSPSQQPTPDPNLQYWYTECHAPREKFVGWSPCPSGTFPLPYDKPDSSKGFTCSGHTWIAQQHVVGNTDCRLVLRHNTEFRGNDIAEFPNNVMDYKNAMAQCPVYGCIGMICRGSADPQSVPTNCWLKDQTHLTVSQSPTPHSNLQYWYTECHAPNQ